LASANFLSYGKYRVNGAYTVVGFRGRPARLGQPPVRLRAGAFGRWGQGEDDAISGAWQRVFAGLDGRAPAAAAALVLAVLLAASATLLVAHPAAAEPAAFARNARISGDAAQTRFSVDLSAGVTAEVFTLASPYRVIVDLPDVGFKLPDAAGRSGGGLVKAFRYGLFAERKARIVIDTDGPVRIVKAEMTAAAAGGVTLGIDIARTDAASFGSGTGAARSAAADAKPSVYEDAAAKKGQRTRPVIVIDPGHGGIDPGALGSSTVLEKHVVLAVAKALKEALAAGGHYDVRMTRSSDVFVSLENRVAMSRKAAADLFISLHADSIDAKQFARSIRGSTVYTLSEKASDEQARLKAEKENASDLVAGLQQVATDGSDDVRNILIDLIKRETQNFSTEFARSLVPRLAKAVPPAKDPQRGAAFVVLKQTDTPSVLIELGYLSNPEDEKLLVSPEWQKQIAAAIRGAVDAYFLKHTARQ
jgi:N-acetylmuramoyl-L-alanine amidase